MVYWELGYRIYTIRIATTRELSTFNIKLPWTESALMEMTPTLSYSNQVFSWPKLYKRYSRVLSTSFRIYVVHILHLSNAFQAIKQSIEKKNLYYNTWYPWLLVRLVRFTKKGEFSLNHKLCRLLLFKCQTTEWKVADWSRFRFSRGMYPYENFNFEDPKTKRWESLDLVWSSRHSCWHEKAISPKWLKL